MVELVGTLGPTLQSVGDLAQVVVQAASSGSGDGNTGFLFLLLLAGPLFYGLTFVRYRNIDKRHRHESETKAEMDHVTGGDEFVRSMTRLRNSRMTGANGHGVRGAIRRWF